MTAEEYLKKVHCFKPNEIREFRGDRLAEMMENYTSQSLPSGTANDLFNKFCTLMNKDYSEYIIKDKEGFIKAIASNKASQFVQSFIPEITDEEIEKESENKIDRGVKTNFQTGADITALRRRMWSYGAKWYRARLRELKGEVKK